MVAITDLIKLTLRRREVDVAALTKDRDSLIKAKKEIKLKFDLTETWLTDYARVSIRSKS